MYGFNNYCQGWEARSMLSTALISLGDNSAVYPSCGADVASCEETVCTFTWAIQIQHNHWYNLSVVSGNTAIVQYRYPVFCDGWIHGAM